jgi:hypothetical protein
MDVLLTLPFAIPVVVQHVLLGIAALDRSIGRTSLALPLDPHTVLFANLMGVLAVLWNGARVVATSTDLARLDVPARWIVASLLVGYVVLAGATPLLLAFVVTEVVGAWIQWRALRA